MDDLERHGEVMGELKGLGQKIDSHISTTEKVHRRHEKGIAENATEIGNLKDFQSRTKGVALAATIGATLLAGIAGVVAKAKELL